MPTRRPALTLLALCLGYALVILDATIVNVALPDLGRSLGAGTGALQWVVDAYTLAFAALLLTGGALADRLGARRVLIAGLAMFGAASAACGAAPGLAVLVSMRALQGAGAALIVPASLALVQAAYADPGARARAVGAWGAIAGVSAASGPLLGGLLVTTLGWRAVFLVSVPAAAAALALVVRHVPRAPRPTVITAPATGSARPRVDLLGQALAAVALCALALALIEGGERGWTAPEALVAGVVAVVAGAALVRVEHRSPSAMLPRALLARPAFAAAIGVGLLINLGFYGQLFAVSVFLQSVRGMGALATGLALLPQGVMVSVASALSGRASARHGPRRSMAIGLAVGAAGFLALAFAGASTPYALLAPCLAAIGFGMAFTMPAATTAAVAAAPPQRAGIASGTLNASRQVGGAIGVALAGAASATTSGLTLAGAIACAAFLLALVLTAGANRGAGYAEGRAAPTRESAASR